MSRPSAGPRLSGAGELAAALPLLCGFAPAESLVLVCLRGTGTRVGLTVRVDLPAQQHEDAVVEEVQARLAAAGVRRAYAVVLTEEPGERPRAGLVAGLQRRLGLDLVDLLLVRDGRWRSYRCAEPACCPPGGSPVPVRSPTLTLVRAQAALDGRAVLPSRAALVEALAPPQDPAPHLHALGLAEERLAAERLALGPARVRRRLLRTVRRSLRAGTGELRLVAPLSREPDGNAIEPEPGEGPPDLLVSAELALALGDVVLRDEVLTWSLAEGEELLSLLLALARCTPAPFDAPVCACLAWVAYGRGDGATASIALDRALDTDPEHGLALLLRQALDAQVPPRQLRSVVVRTALELGRRR